MVWRFTAVNHNLAINPLVRSWIRSSLLDRFLKISLAGLFYIVVVAILFWKVNPEAIPILGMLPWALLGIDTVVENRYTTRQLGRFTSRPDVSLATRAEYLGGHPQLPHSRFVYLTLNGTRENPLCTILLPAKEEAEIEAFPMPILDLDRTRPLTQEASSLAGDIMAALSYRPGRKLFSSELVTLEFRYAGEAGRKHTVELTHFWLGNDEIRTWRNFFVCAQYEADTGGTPRAPWKTLVADYVLPPIPEVIIGGNGRTRSRPATRDPFGRR